MVRNVPRNALMLPSDAEHRLGNQRFRLGDRVVYAQESGRVPIAARGTVIGISRTSHTVLLDIIFDERHWMDAVLHSVVLQCQPHQYSTSATSRLLPAQRLPKRRDQQQLTLH